MAISTTWGYSPVIPLSVAFYSSSVEITVGGISGNSYFGYPIYVDVYSGSTLLKSGYQIKGATPSQWTTFIPTLLYSGVTRVRIWASGSGVTRGAINIYSNGTVTNESGSNTGGTTDDDTGGGSSGGSSSGSGSAGSTITEASFGLSCGNITLGAANTITVTRPTASYTPTFSYSFGSSSGSFSPTLVSSSTTKLVYSWTPAESLCSQIPNSVNGSGTITMSIGGYTKYYSFIAVVPESVLPTASLSVEVVNDNAGVTVCAKGLSRLSYTASGAGVYGSTITGYEFIFAGQTLTGSSGTTGLIASSGSLRPSVTVTDSRGRRTTVSAANVTVYDYGNPVIRSSYAVRRDGDGNESEDGAYIYAQCEAECSDLNGTNALTIQARYKETGGSYSGYVDVGESETLVGSGLTSGASYVVEITATDSVGNSRVVEHTNFGSSVAFHLKDGGNGAAFGKYSEEEECLDCLWDAMFRGDVEVDGSFTMGGKTPVAIGSTLYDMGMLDLIYPVGAVYISTSSTNPDTLFGGVWTAIEGKFLLGAGSGYDAGSEAGNASVSLTDSQLPNHTHSLNVSIGDHTYTHSHAIGADKDGAFISGNYGNYTVHSGGYYGSPDYTMETSQDSVTLNHNVSATLGSTGLGQSFSIMPPYLAVYMWQRTE